MADPEFILLGDALWLDFVNTARGRGPVTDRLPDAAAYHRWTKATRIGSVAGGTWPAPRATPPSIHSPSNATAMSALRPWSMAASQ